MKHMIILTMTLLSITAIAGTIKYSNKVGCVVEVESRNNGQIYYVSKEGKTEIVGLTNDLMSGTFAYCADSALQINYFEGSKGVAILMACNEHVNGNARTRGRVDIEIMNKALTKISIDGQVKSLLGWKQDTKILCDNLVRR